jgi:esterase
MILESRVCATDGTTLAVTTWGDTPASIVLIHGFADARYVWSPFARSLMNRAGVLAMDLRGHGDSDWDLDGTYCVNTFVADVQTILDRLCSNHLVLVGHSLGAEIAVRLAAGDEQRIRAIVLVEGGPGTAAAGVNQARARFSSRMRTFVSRGDYQRTLSDWLPMADADMVSLSARQALRQSDDGYRLKCDPELAQMAPPDADGTLWSLFESLRCPSLLIRAEASAVLSRHAANEMVRRGAIVRCESVAMAGHAVMMDNPKEFGSILQRFVADLYRRPCDDKSVHSQQTP